MTPDWFIEHYRKTFLGDPDELWNWIMPQMSKLVTHWQYEVGDKKTKAQLEGCANCKGPVDLQSAAMRVFKDLSGFDIVCAECAKPE